jgi:hypothetical protein
MTERIPWRFHTSAHKAPKRSAGQHFDFQPPPGLTTT